MQNLRGFIRFLLIAVVIATPLWAQSGNTTETVPGEVLIKLNPNFVATSSARNDVFTQIRQLANVDREESIGGNGAIRFHSASMNVQALIDVLSRLPFVDVVQPNFVYHTMAVPNDPSFGQLWGLRNTGQTVGGTAGTAGADIEAVPAWDVTTGSTSVVVSIIDTGIDYNHPDLAANVWSAPSAFSVTIGGSTINCAAGTHGFNAITRTCNPLDDNNHGSHVAGTIGATGNNGVGVVGVNWTTKIVAAKFLNSSGSGNTADAVNALEFLIQVKQIFGAAANIRVCSNSWGGGGFDQVMLDEINKANTNGILFVAAAGNAGTNNDTTPNYPSNYNAPNVVAVAATDNRDAKASFSNYGRTTVHLGAPGVNILSTTRNNTYSSFSGTSMATPHVSGAAALVLAACPALNTAQLKSTILNNVEPISSMSTTTITGGRLNVYRAIQACGGGATPDFTVSVSPTSRTITAGTSTTYTVTVGATGGFSGTVSLGVGGLPSGATASFSPASITTSGTSTLTVTTATSTPAGTSSLTITGTSGTTSHSAGASLVVQAATTPDFTVSASPSSRSITPGASTTYTVTVGATGGFTGTVSLGVGGLPAGATGSFSPASITTSGTSTLTVTTTTSTPVGTSNLTITGTSGSTSHSAAVSLVVSSTPPAGKTVGYTTVFGSISTVANRRAQPVTMAEGGTLTAVTMWHRGGSGNVIFGIYSGATVPTTRIAVTASTPQSATDGWQTIPLTAPVRVAANTRVWLAWVYQSATGTAYQTGTPGRVQSTATWSGGMPASWGSSATSASNIYSINATYTPDSTSPNLALNKPATASSSYSSSYPPSRTVDGNTATYWASGAKSTYGTTQWLAVDLGSTNSVSRARISWSSTNYATNYNIQYLNGSTWTNCATITDGGPGLAFREISFPAVNAQQFRVYATAGGSGSYYTIYEFELYTQ